MKLSAIKLNNRRFYNSLSFILARNCVLTAFLVGLLLSSAQISFDYFQEQDAVKRFASEILAANKFAAADATYHLDAPAAEELAKGILQYHNIISVTISNEDSTTLVQLNKNTKHLQTPAIHFKILGDLQDFHQPLYLNSGEYMGELTIQIDPIMASEKFVDRSVLILLLGLVRNIFLTLLLIFIFYYTTTKKVVNISRQLQALDLNNPDKSRIPVSNQHMPNELDDLGHNINRMLNIITSDIQDRDVREQDLLESQNKLTYQANHDQLTGLLNRRGFEHHLHQTMITHQVDNTDHVFCYLDLDQFKIINDTCGHVAGDELLKQISNLLKSSTRSHDVLARLGGDEFGLLMKSCDLEGASQIAQSLIEKVSHYRFLWQSQQLSVSVSIGIALFTSSIKSTTDLLRNADIACYAAKNAGRNCFRVFEEGAAELNQISGDMEWIARINDALETNRFSLFAQTINGNDPQSDERLHYEVLLRMVEKNGELIAPGVFLPAAEKYNLITKIDCWVIKNLFHYLSTHPDHLQRLALCAINLSGSSLTSTAFQKTLAECFEKYHIPPQKICFEITETAAISNLSDAIAFIDTMSKQGCKFALDDFGTGLSSFAYLKYLPVDYLKIDGLFVKSIVDDPIDYAMVKSINEIGHVMGKKTIAEFVENDEIIEKLKVIGVDYSQGYGIAMPCPIDDL